MIIFIKCVHFILILLEYYFRFSTTLQVAVVYKIKFLCCCYRFVLLRVKGNVKASVRKRKREKMNVSVLYDYSFKIPALLLAGFRTLELMVL